MNIEQIFQDVSKFLPKAIKAKAISIYPLPYADFYEVYVEAQDGKRYRALANKVRTISEFVELEIPGGLKNGIK